MISELTYQISIYFGIVLKQIVIILIKIEIKKSIAPN